MKIVNFLYKNWNIGDLASSPLNYFKFNNIETEIVNIFNEKYIETLDNSSIHSIIGGGGILNYDNKIFKNILNKSRTSTVWGAGNHGKMFNNLQTYPNENEKYNNSYLEENSTFFSFRDYKLNKNNYVPCSSCMFKGFDEKFEKKRKIGVFIHAEFKDDSMTKFHKYSHMYNDYGKTSQNHLEPLYDIIKYINESEILITNSYHGSYFGLLSKNVKVISYPISNKFFYMKDLPYFSHPDNLDDDLKNSKKIIKYKNLINEYRSININYYNKIKNTIIND